MLRPQESSNTLAERRSAVIVWSCAICNGGAPSRSRLRSQPRLTQRCGQAQISRSDH